MKIIKFFSVAMMLVVGCNESTEPEEDPNNAVTIEDEQNIVTHFHCDLSISDYKDGVRSVMGNCLDIKSALDVTDIENLSAISVFCKDQKFNLSGRYSTYSNLNSCNDGLVRMSKNLSQQLDALGY